MFLKIRTFTPIRLLIIVLPYFDDEDFMVSVKEDLVGVINEALRESIMSEKLIQKLMMMFSATTSLLP